MITELRPLHTSMGLAENIKRNIASEMSSIIANDVSELHLLEYKQKMLEYLQHAQHRRRVSPFGLASLEAFSGPYALDGYADTSITDDLITDVYLEFGERTRKIESERHIRTLTGCAHLIFTNEKLT